MAKYKQPNPEVEAVARAALDAEYKNMAPSIAEWYEENKDNLAVQSATISTSYGDGDTWTVEASFHGPGTEMVGVKTEIEQGWGIGYTSGSGTVTVDTDAAWATFVKGQSFTIAVDDPIRTETEFPDPEPEDWMKASKILDEAHDILMVSGIQCKQTYGQAAEAAEGDPFFGEPVTYTHPAKPNCIWEAIDIAMTGGNKWIVDDASEEEVLCGNYENAVSLCSDPYAELHSDLELRAVGIVMAGKDPGWNDSVAQADEILDALREGAKRCRDIADTGVIPTPPPPAPKPQPGNFGQPTGFVLDVTP